MEQPAQEGGHPLRGLLQIKILIQPGLTLPRDRKQKKSTYVGTL